MKELTTYLRYFFLSSFLFIVSCSGGVDTVDEETEVVEEKLPLNRRDSILQLADELDIEYDPETENIHDIFTKVIAQRKNLMSKLDSLNDKADDLERLAYEYTIKKDKEAKKRLLSEIAKIKDELNRIKILADKKAITINDNKLLEEVEVPFDTKTLQSLTPGNYLTRLDKYRILPVHISENSEVTIGKPILDSTSVLHGGSNMSPRVKKELEQIKLRMKNQD